MKINRLAVIVSSILVSMANVHAAGILTEEAGSWVQVVAEGSLKAVDPSLEKTRLWVEGQARFNNDFNQFYQGVVRAAIGYSLSDRATIWAGYTWVPTRQFNKPPVSQQDIWPAFRYILPTEIGTVTFRTMLESTFLKGNEVRFRPRQMVRFVHPLDMEPRLSLIAWDEFFVRFHSTQYGGKAGFDQNRAFAGAGWNVDKDVRLELGYLNQYLDDATHKNNTMQHLILGSLFVNF
jgi:hypothetical protein